MTKDEQIDRERFDKNGIKLQPGDFMIHKTGGGKMNGIEFDSYTLYEMPKYCLGQGIHYIRGEKSDFYHAEYEDSEKLDKEKHEELYHQFLHGKTWITSPKGIKTGDEIIKNQIEWDNI